MFGPSLRSGVFGVCFVGAAAAALTITTPATAQISGVEIIAASVAGSGNDQAARAIGEILEAEGLASGVQVLNVRYGRRLDDPQ